MDGNGFEIMADLLEKSRDEMAETLSRMIAIKAISPLSGGDGESNRARFLKTLLESWGFQVKEYVYKDDTGTDRPNLAVKYGAMDKTIWIIPHMDTVSEGDPGLWNSNPFIAKADAGKIYGRGTNDNGQALVSSIYALKALKESGASLEYSVGIALVADEEVGSRYGIAKLMNEGIFSENDLFLVPDWGDPSGSLIELGEKSLLWLKITVHGKQVHASTPEEGANANKYAVRFLYSIDNFLYGKYTKENALFSPPVSTFEMTKREKNVDSTNIIPGIDISYLDCRILPEYSVDEVIADLRRIASGPEFSRVKIEIEEVVREDAAPPTGKDSAIVALLSHAIAKLRKVEPRYIGIGGGTCAAFTRRAGFPTAVWSTIDDVAHRPNEYAKIRDMVEDAKVFAFLYLKN